MVKSWTITSVPPFRGNEPQTQHEVHFSIIFEKDTIDRTESPKKTNKKKPPIFVYCGRGYLLVYFSKNPNCYLRHWLMWAFRRAPALSLSQWNGMRGESYDFIGFFFCFLCETPNWNWVIGAFFCVCETPNRFLYFVFPILWIAI